MVSLILLEFSTLKISICSGLFLFLLPKTELLASSRLKKSGFLETFCSNFMKLRSISEGSLKQSKISLSPLISSLYEMFIKFSLIAIFLLRCLLISDSSSNELKIRNSSFLSKFLLFSKDFPL